MAEVIYVNQDKKNRAELIVAGKTNGEVGVDTIAWWAAKIKAEKPENAVQFVYEGLGGLIGNSPEGKAVAARQEAAKKEKVRKGK